MVNFTPKRNVMYMSGTHFPTLLSFLPLLPESVRTVARAYAEVITKFSGIDRFPFSIPSLHYQSGVIHIGISDHSAIYRIRKVTHLRSNMLNMICSNIEVRQLKNFNEAEFVRDLCMIDCNHVTTHNNPNEMWDFWKHLLASVIDKHALFRTKRNCCAKYIKEIF